MTPSDGVRVGAGKRPASRKALAVVCASAALLLGVCAGGYLHWVNQLPPPEPETAVLPVPNGYDACVAAVSRFSSSGSLDLRNASARELRAFLTPNRPASADLRLALLLPFRTPPIRDPLALPSLYFANCRKAARSLAAEARLAQLEGRPEAGMGCALDAMDLGSRVGIGGSVLYNSLGAACGDIAWEKAERCVSALNRSESRQAGKRLDAILARFPTLPQVLEAERRERLWDLRQVLSGQAAATDVYGDEVRAPPGYQRMLRSVRARIYPKAWTYNSVNAYLRTLIQEASLPYLQRRTVTPPDLPFDHFASPFPMLERGSAGSFEYRFATAQAYLRLLRLELALHERRLRDGAYPRALQDLTPVELPSLPDDPFTGGSFVYRRQGAGYRLYSIGPDGNDDGGKVVINRVLSSPTDKGDLVVGGPSPRTN